MTNDQRADSQARILASELRLYGRGGIRNTASSSHSLGGVVTAGAGHLHQTTDLLVVPTDERNASSRWACAAGLRGPVTASNLPGQRLPIGWGLPLHRFLKPYDGAWRLHAGHRSPNDGGQSTLSFTCAIVLPQRDTLSPRMTQCAGPPRTLPASEARTYLPPPRRGRRSRTWSYPVT